MAQDVWTMINRELEKAQRASSGKSETPFLDAISETMKYAKEDRQWKERKNLQRQEIIATFSKGLGTMYNNDDVAIQRDRAQSYMDKYSGDMDEATMEMAQMTIDNFNLQEEKNNSFAQFSARQDSEMKKVTDFTNSIEIGKEYSDEDWAEKVEEFRGVVDGYTDYTEKFAEKHSERLSHPSYQHINQNLAHGAYINQFTLDSFFDGKKLDEVEYKARKQSIASNSIKPVTDYNRREASFIKTASDNLLSKIDANVQSYKNIEAQIRGEALIQIPGGDPVYFKELSGPEQEALEDQLFTLSGQIKLDDKTQETRVGESYIGYQYPNLFPKTETPPQGTPPPGTPLPPKTPGGQDQAKITDQDVSNIQLYMKDSKGYNSTIAKEFRKSRRGKEDMTLKEFLENRPDLAGDIKDAYEHKIILEDAKKFLEKEFDYNKIGETTYAKEDGNRIRYTTYYLSPDGKIVSTSDLKRRKKDALNYLGATMGGSRSNWENMHDELANAKLYKIKSVYDPYKREWTELERKEA
jgi:hypothetical protein